MALENVNDILSLFTILVIICVPLYFIGQQALLWYENITNKRIERMMNEDDWHM